MTSASENPLGQADACIRCHACQTACAFLKKHRLDLGDTERLRKLAYHCFLCGRCAEVCPQGIDGSRLVRALREERVRAAGDRLDERGFLPVVAEKGHYPFKNYRHAKAPCALFVGCSLPSFLPRTTRALARTAQAAGVGTIYDCCGKPLADLGLEKQADAVMRGIARRLARNGVEEVVAACPNCHAYLKEHLGMRVASVYEKLRLWGVGGAADADGRMPATAASEASAGCSHGAPAQPSHIAKRPGAANQAPSDDLAVFPPCPDRRDRAWLALIEPFWESQPAIVADAPCCGFGGCAQAKEPDIARGMARRAGAHGNVRVYCASCAGSLARSGQAPRHVLSDILGIDEEPDTGHSLWNRAKAKLI